MSVSIVNYCLPHIAKWRDGFALRSKTLATLVLPLFIFSQASGQSADIDQGQNGSATSRTSPVSWINGNLGPSGAHFAEGYSIPYRMKIASLVGNSSTVHHLIIEWDTKDQNGHALDYITYYNNMDNPSGSHQANFSHATETIDPTFGTAFSGAPTLFQIPMPSSIGAEVSGMPGQSFTDLPGAGRSNNANATKMAIWGGTITALTYVSENNQNATTASTKTSLDISFTSANGSTALIAWGGHIAAEYDWGTGRGASKVNGSPYHMRLVSIDGKGGNQDRSLKASAVLVPTVGCTLSAAQTACEGSSAGLVYSYTGSTAGITNYSWTLTPSTTNAVISGGNTTTTKSGAAVTSVTIVPATGTTFAVGTFSLSLTLTNLGGAGTPCTTSGTINPAATANAGADQTVCSSSPAVTLAGSIGGGATSGTWSGGAGSFNPNATTLNAVYTPSATEVSNGTVTLTLTTNNPDGPCEAVSNDMVIAISAQPSQPTAAVKTPLCTDATMAVEVTLPSGLSSGATVTLSQATGGASPITKNASDAVSGKLTFTGLTFGKGYSITITDNVSTGNPNGCTSTALECGVSGGLQARVNNNESARVIDQKIILNSNSQPNVVAAPNPFNDRIRFSLQSAVSGQGSLELYNTLGQKVKTVFQGQVEAGKVQTIEYSVPGSQRHNLIYLFRVGDQKVSGKLIGLK
jgi:hypothetical protein